MRLYQGESVSNWLQLHLPSSCGRYIPTDIQLLRDTMPVNQSLVAAVALMLLPQLPLRGFRVSLAGSATSIIFVATKHVICRDKSIIVATNVIFVFCHDKSFVAASIRLSRQKTRFFTTKMILVAAPANDIGSTSFGQWETRSALIWSRVKIVWYANRIIKASSSGAVWKSRWPSWTPASLISLRFLWTA